jgi:hypothetical protein
MKRQKDVDNVIRLFFDNLDGWEKKNGIKFGAGTTSKTRKGYQKIK